MAEETQVGRFNSPEEAWGAVELGLKNYPDAGAEREERIGAVRNIAEGTRQYFLFGGDRQAITDKMGRMKLPVTLLMDTDSALGELGKRYVDDGNRLEEGDWSFFEGVVSLREAIEAGKAGDPGVSQEFKDRTQSVKGWLAREMRKRRVEYLSSPEGPRPPGTEAVPTQAELTERWDRVKSLEAVADLDDQHLGQLVRDIVVVFAGRGMKWSASEIQVMVFLAQKLDLVKRGLGQLEHMMRPGNGNKDMLKLYWSFVFALPRKNLDGQQQDILKRAYKMAEGGGI